LCKLFPRWAGNHPPELPSARNAKDEKGAAAVTAAPFALHGLQIFCSRLSGLAVHHDLEGNSLAFSQLTKAGAFNGADMDEDVFAAALGLNESITLLRIEPFHGTVVHGSLLIDVSYEPREYARLGSLEILVKDRQSGAVFFRCVAKSFGRKLDPTYLAATGSVCKAVPDRA
jgi:hypothetical protein